MGVPSFFRWLSIKYPSIVVHVNEEELRYDEEDRPIPIDITKKNPNNIEFDNLYLDMNGIIHPCTHPTNKPEPENEEEMFFEIFNYIDRLMAICRPRRLLYMAVDGVAPRAKMNQQRSRRFRTAQESEELRNSLDRKREEIISSGGFLPEKKKNHFDSNCITPGTSFMSRLALALRYYIHERINSNSGWSDLQVILSDACVPGEGEHKIMDFIRRQRAMPNYDPNTVHCLCGADADLIMLGLATHEPHFTIIREEFKPNMTTTCELCKKANHSFKDCTGISSAEHSNKQDSDEPVVAQDSTKFIFIRLDVLREYLDVELKDICSEKLEWNLERAIDDWVLICFFVGNDFLPHLPSLEIREKAIDRLVTIYKDCIRYNGEWLSLNGIVNFKGLEYMVSKLGEYEDRIFVNRRNSTLQYRERFSNNSSFKNSRNSWSNGDKCPIGQRTGSSTGYDAARPLDQWVQSSRSDFSTPNQSRAQSLREEFRTKRMQDNEEKKGLKRSYSEMEKSHTSGNNNELEQPKEEMSEYEREDMSDQVKLYENGWRERYYLVKFGINVEKYPDFPALVAMHYARGIAWVLSYYYQGCVSWSWYYPYHYAPFASDFKQVSQTKVPFKNYLPASSDPRELKIRESLFKKDKPFKPLEQLMAVFPASSSSHIPEGLRFLMSDPDSPIIDFYPIRFKIDLNGKIQAWQGVSLLPFVDGPRLKRTVKMYLHLLTPEESELNIRGENSYFVRTTHIIYKNISAEGLPLGESRKSLNVNDDSKYVFGDFSQLPDNDRSLWPVDGLIKSPIPQFLSCYSDILSCKVLQTLFWDPSFSSDFIYKSILLQNVVLPEPTLKPGDIGLKNACKRFFDGPNPNRNYPRLGFGQISDQYPSLQNNSDNSRYDPRVAQRMIERSTTYNHSNRNSNSSHHENYSNFDNSKNYNQRHSNSNYNSNNQTEFQRQNDYSNYDSSNKDNFQRSKNYNNYNSNEQDRFSRPNNRNSYPSHSDHKYSDRNYQDYHRQSKNPKY